jgi:hypothetical protein
MIIKQLSVFLENKSGRLTEVTGALADADIDISTFSIADTAEFGVLRMIVTKPDAAFALLKEKGFSVHVTDVLALVVPHQSGSLHRALQVLSAAEISIEYMYAFALDDRATVIIRTDTPQQAIEVLQKHKMELLSASDVYEL